MYSFIHQHPRLRTTYDTNNRFNPYQQTNSTDQERSQRSLADPWTNGTMATDKQNNDSSGVRRTRYVRSSTISVTQLLTDSCSSLLQKLTTRVRGPSQIVDNRTSAAIGITSPSTSVSQNTESSLIGSTRSRLEDKYSAVLERLAGKRRDPERTLEPSTSKTIEKRANPLTKSATSVVLSEKAYPYVSGIGYREKTPYRSSAHRLSQHQHQSHYPEPPYAYLDQHSAYNMRQKPSNVSELRPRRSARPMRTGKSEVGNERPVRNNLMKLCPVEIPSCSIEEVPTSRDATPTNSDYVDPQIVEREARRKEIQSLIMKYSALDEAYNKATNNSAVPAAASSAALASSAPVAKAPQPPPHSNKFAHKYQPSMIALTVSNTG